MNIETHIKNGIRDTEITLSKGLVIIIHEVEGADIDAVDVITETGVWEVSQDGFVDLREDRDTEFYDLGITQDQKNSFHIRYHPEKLKVELLPFP